MICIAQLLYGIRHQSMVASCKTMVNITNTKFWYKVMYRMLNSVLCINVLNNSPENSGSIFKFDVLRLVVDRCDSFAELADTESSVMFVIQLMSGAAMFVVPFRSS